MVAGEVKSVRKQSDCSFIDQQYQMKILKQCSNLLSCSNSPCNFRNCISAHSRFQFRNSKCLEWHLCWRMFTFIGLEISCLHFVHFRCPFVIVVFRMRILILLLRSEVSEFRDTVIRFVLCATSCAPKDFLTFSCVLVSSSIYKWHLSNFILQKWPTKRLLLSDIRNE